MEGRQRQRPGYCKPERMGALTLAKVQVHSAKDEEEPISIRTSKEKGSRPAGGTYQTRGRRVLVAYDGPSAGSTQVPFGHQVAARV